MVGRPGGLVVNLERYALELVLGFDFHVGRTSEFICKTEKTSSQQLRALAVWAGTIRCEREENSWNLPAINMKAFPVVGRGGRACLVTPDLSYVYIGKESRASAKAIEWIWTNQR